MTSPMKLNLLESSPRVARQREASRKIRNTIALGVTVFSVGAYAARPFFIKNPDSVAKIDYIPGLNADVSGTLYFTGIGSKGSPSFVAKELKLVLKTPGQYTLEIITPHAYDDKVLELKHSMFQQVSVGSQNYELNIKNSDGLTLESFIHITYKKGDNVNFSSASLKLEP